MTAKSPPALKKHQRRATWKISVQPPVLGGHPAGALKETPAAWSGVFAMSLCVFALIASEFMPVSLLTPIAADLGITEGAAGQGIAVSGVFAVLASLSISGLTGGINRKTLLLWLTGMMGISAIIVGCAHSYVVFMLGRALIGIVVGGFWSMSAAMAMRLVPAAKVPRALAIFNGGNALASIVAAPLGSYLGALVGWRGSFFCLVPVALIALVWQWGSLPGMHNERLVKSANVFRLFKSKLVTLGMLAAGLFFMGQFMLYTYLRPFLDTVTQVDVPTLSLILLAIGVAGFIGTMLIGTLLKLSLYRTLIGIPLLMAALAVTLIVMGSHVAAVATLLALWGLVATAAPVGWWIWLAKTMPQDAEAGGGLFVAVVQLAIATGSTVGGILFDVNGYRTTFATSAGVLVAASLMTFVASRAGSRT